jgi:fatty acid desaturase
MVSFVNWLSVGLSAWKKSWHRGRRAEVSASSATLAGFARGEGVLEPHCDTTGFDKDPKTDPRESMTRLPAPLQWILTEMTGKASVAEEPVWLWTPLRRLALTFCVLMFGLWLSLFAVRIGGVAWILIIPGWLLTVSAQRTSQTSFLHHAAHGSLLGNERSGRWLAELMSAIVWIQPESAYRPAHVQHHGYTATTEDPDLLLLALFGFRPGLTVTRYWVQFVYLLLSPRFHTVYASFRLQANFVTVNTARKLVSVVWTGFLAGAAVWTGSVWEVALVWLVPAWPLFQMAGLCQLLTEHNWVRIGARSDRRRPRIILGKLTHARFFGEPLPKKGGLATILLWAARMALLHFPVKLFCVQADLCNHDLHHRIPKSDWANAAYARRDAVVGDQLHGWSEWTERWGFIEAANSTFLLLSLLPEDAVLGEPLTYGDIADGVLGM